MSKEKIYVTNEGKDIFTISLDKKNSYLDNDNLSNSYLQYKIEMLACIDFTDDNTQTLDYCSKYNCNSIVREDSMIVYIIHDSLESRLKEEGYTIVDEKKIEDMSIHFGELAKNELMMEIIKSRRYNEEEKINAMEKIEIEMKDLFTEENINKYKKDSNFFFNYLVERIK